MRCWFWGTVVWGLWEVGPDFFALAPRLDILGSFGLMAYSFQRSHAALTMLKGANELF